MAIWQLRLGENGQKHPDWREVHLADKYSLVTIDYSIEKDIGTMKTYTEIRSHVEEVQHKYRKSRTAISAYMRQILNFKNDIEIGEYFISPFNYLNINGNPISGGKRGNYRIGIIESDMGTLKSLFEGDLSAFLAQHAYSTYLERELTEGECGNIPTRKVKWLSDTFPSTSLTDAIFNQKHTGTRKGTVAKLEFAEDLPHGLVKDPKNITWL